MLDERLQTRDERTGFALLSSSTVREEVGYGAFHSEWCATKRRIQGWIRSSVTFVSLVFRLSSFVVLSACTDYVQQMEDDFSEWKAAQAEDGKGESTNVSVSSSSNKSSGDKISSGAVAKSSGSKKESSEASSSSKFVLNSSEGSAGSLSSANFVNLSSVGSAIESSSSAESSSSEDEKIKVLPVMMFDWLHGNFGDGGVSTSVTVNGDTNIFYRNGAKDLYYNDPIYAISNDFGSGGCGGSNAKDSNNGRYMRGMVEEILGANGVPVQAAVFPENCKLTTHINEWFLPQVVVQKNGKDYTNMTCRSIEFVRDSNGFWIARKDETSPEGGLFLLDDFQYLDEENTVENPFFDSLSTSNRYIKHNYGFTMKIQATFQYSPGQHLKFSGDDDVWIFINNRLVVDLGGQHAKASGGVSLDTLGLVVGEAYPFHVFYAERHTASSNFVLETSINLRPDPNLCSD